MSTFDEPGRPDDRVDPSSAETGGGLANSDINSEDADGSGTAGGSTAEAASGDDAERGNLDGSTAFAEPRENALEAAQTQAEGADAQRESGQDNGLSS